jgi:hypothetical protein
MKCLHTKTNMIFNVNVDANYIIILTNENNELIKFERNGIINLNDCIIDRDYYFSETDNIFDSYKKKRDSKYSRYQRKKI